MELFFLVYVYFFFISFSFFSLMLVGHVQSFCCLPCLPVDYFFSLVKTVTGSCKSMVHVARKLLLCSESQGIGHHKLWLQTNPPFSSLPMHSLIANTSGYVAGGDQFSISINHFQNESHAACIILFYFFSWAEEHQNTFDQHMSCLCAVHEGREAFRKVKRKGVEGFGPLDQDQKGLAAVGLGDPVMNSNVFIVPRVEFA